MERLLQYMDDFDDVIGAFGLVYERLRGILMTIVTLLILAATISSGVLLAIWHPPIALAICALLFVALLYRAVTMPSSEPLQLI